MRKSNRYIISTDPTKRLQWIVRLYCKLTLEHRYDGFIFSFMSEDGGAYERFPAFKKNKSDETEYFKGKTLEEVINKGWEAANVEAMVQHCCALQSPDVDYRKINFKETDEELGIVEQPMTSEIKKED